MVPAGGPPGQGLWRVSWCHEKSTNYFSIRIWWRFTVVTVVDAFAIRLHMLQAWLDSRANLRCGNVASLWLFQWSNLCTCILVSGSPPPSGPMQMGPPPVYWPQGRREIMDKAVKGTCSRQVGNTVVCIFVLAVRPVHSRWQNPPDCLLWLMFHFCTWRTSAGKLPVHLRQERERERE